MRKYAIVSIHLMFWMVVLIAPLFITLSSSEDVPFEIIIFNIIESLLSPIVFYSFFLFIIPRTIKTKGNTFEKILIYSIAGLLLFGLRISIVYGIDRIAGLGFGDHSLYGIKFFTSLALNTMIMIGFSLLIRIALYWSEDQHKRTELKLEEHRLELELLKAEINPHFFFNTLNNIYSLVYKKSNDAPAAVMKLSEIMRYMIYDSKAEMVPLEKEVEQLNNYIELERLRIKDDDFIHFETKGNFESHTVPPMLFLSFAENAFKHGKRKVLNPGIRIVIAAEDGLIKYSVTNYILKEPHNNHLGDGIGMENTRRRLELLYPKCHKLDIRSDRDKYNVRLTLHCKF